uniref:Uncharacterized protein n=1 Tax=Sphaerodactylus townsendi TaxID=933632 RepID=A0ACB8FSF2_9SAUR
MIPSVFAVHDSNERVGGGVRVLMHGSRGMSCSSRYLSEQVVLPVEYCPTTNTIGLLSWAALKETQSERERQKEHQQICQDVYESLILRSNQQALWVVFRLQISPGQVRLGWFSEGLGKEVGN